MPRRPKRTEAIKEPQSATLQPLLPRLPAVPDPPDLEHPTLVDIPPRLLESVPPRHQRLALRLYRGENWPSALRAEGYSRRNSPRKPTDMALRRIETIVAALLNVFADRAAASRSWIKANLVHLYAIGSGQALESKGKIDIAGARGCLELLGRDIGMFGHDRGVIPTGEVAQLLAAVASARRPSLPGDRARVINPTDGEPSR